MKSKIFTLLSTIAGRDAHSRLRICEQLTSRENFIDFQKQALENLLLSAYRTVPYYHRLFEDYQLVDNGKVFMERFSSLPVLTKDFIRENGTNLVASDFKKRKWFYDYSGGSTGQPLKLMHDTNYLRWCDASFFYWYKHFLGIDEIAVKKIVLWGSSRDLFLGSSGWKDKLANWAHNTVLLNSFKMDEVIFAKYIAKINSFKPELIRGYATSLFELCKYAQNHSLTLHHPKRVVSSAEMLTPEMRHAIETTFGQTVYDFYGSREISSLAGQCCEGLFHVLGFHSYIEVLDQSDRVVTEGQEGRIVVTDLHNYSMPLIRYEIGDLATLGPDICKCGSILPTLKTLNGRTSEYFLSKDRSLIYPLAITFAMSSLDWARGFQLIQEEYSKIRILVVSEGEVREADKIDIENKIRFLLGQDCAVHWEFVAEIPLTPQGKRRYVYSNMK